MAFNISYIYVAKDRFTAVSKRVSKSANRVRARMRLLRRQTKSTGDAFDGLGQKFAAFAALAGTLLIFAQPIRQAIEFESALSDLNKVMEFRLPSGLQTTSKAIQELSKRLPIAQTGLVDIATAGGQLGIAEDDILGFIETVSKISIAFDILPGEAGESVAALANIFQIPIPEIIGLADSINLVSNNSKAFARDIVGALKNKAAAAGVVMGLTARETVGFATALIETGVNANRVGSILDSMSRRLTDVSVLGPKFVEDFIDNPKERLILLLRQINELKGAKKAQILTKIFGEFSGRVGLLAKTMDTILIPTMKRATDTQAAAGSVQKEFNVRVQTSAAQLTLLGNRARNIGINLGTVFLPAVNAIALALGFLSDGIATVVEFTGPLIPMLIAAAAALALVKIATLAWAVAQAVLNVALFANPIGLIVAGIAAAIVGITFLIKKMGGLKSIFKTIGNVINGFFVSPLSLAAKAIAAITGSDVASKIDNLQTSVKFDVPTIPDATIAGATQKTETEVNVNLNAPPGIIQSIESRTKGEARTNVGQNLVMAGAG